MSIVYVVQRQHKMNHATSTLTPKFDLSSAEEYGTLEFLLSPNTRPFKPEKIVSVLREKLQNYTSDDYLLLIGNPVLIGMTVAVAADLNAGYVQVLQWSNRKYILIQINMR